MLFNNTTYIIKFTLLLVILSQITKIQAMEVALASPYLALKVNLTSNNEYCWILEHSAYMAPNETHGMSIWVTTLGDTEFEAFRFWKEINGSLVESGETELINNDITANPKLYGYNSTYDYCVEVEKYQFDLPVRQYLTKVSYPPISNNTKVFRNKRSVDNDCWNEPCYDVRDCLVIDRACAHCEKYPGMRQQDCEYQYTENIAGFRWVCWMDYLRHCHK
ncbi:hypothetical protein TPHA_0K02378 [Tetrapisispora phaffii CBS 4417]|uniref:Secreted protein n=1 Tax=Tetrapisispora phaffii (strain ATCC 24235 / CBS 4417 / NBRC 1672 / NRRL Y-8282 / UCD 70-5) TaxID=1071381 RepID=G8BZP1_TETPH|nr:hypothetical protein TPHA_0K02378 [Tetrapisispora phaffii CBS 4417]CCE65369.1 hypothetical protein TPHA_0K02378 [Tetrapisispora phaffii CBS 4417]